MLVIALLSCVPGPDGPWPGLRSPDATGYAAQHAGSLAPSIDINGGLSSGGATSWLWSEDGDAFAEGPLVTVSADGDGAFEVDLAVEYPVNPDFEAGTYLARFTGSVVVPNGALANGPLWTAASGIEDDGCEVVIGFGGCDGGCAGVLVGVFDASGTELGAPLLYGPDAQLLGDVLDGAAWRLDGLDAASLGELPGSFGQNLADLTADGKTRSDFFLYSLVVPPDETRRVDTQVLVGESDTQAWTQTFTCEGTFPTIVVE
jgi:hypothetical protein